MLTKLAYVVHVHLQKKKKKKKKKTLLQDGTGLCFARQS